MISNMTIITVQRARLEAENAVIKTFHTFGEKIAGLSVCRKINLWHSAYFVSNCISDLRSNPRWLVQQGCCTSTRLIMKVKMGTHNSDTETHDSFFILKIIMNKGKAKH